MKILKISSIALLFSFCMIYSSCAVLEQILAPPAGSQSQSQPSDSQSDTSGRTRPSDPNTKSGKPKPADTSSRSTGTTEIDKTKVNKPGQRPGDDKSEGGNNVSSENKSTSTTTSSRTQPGAPASTSAPKTSKPAPRPSTKPTKTRPAPTKPSTNNGAEILGKDCIDSAKIDKDAVCNRTYKPVCGCNGKTYNNKCIAERSGVLKYTDGKCKKNACIDKAKINASQPCPTKYIPVCGCNGKTYSNACEAQKAGVVKYAKGKCGTGK